MTERAVITFKYIPLKCPECVGVKRIDRQTGTFVKLSTSDELF